MEQANQSEGSALDSKVSDDTETDSSKIEPKKETKAAVVPKLAYERVSDDMHKYKRELQDANAKLEQRDTDDLEKQKDFQALAEKYKKRAEVAEADAGKVTKYYLQTTKISKVREAALAEGLRSEAVSDLDLLDLDGVRVEATSGGTFNVHGVKECVDSLKTSKPHWFKKSEPPGVNAGGGSPGAIKSGKISPIDVSNAERDFKAGKISKNAYYKVHEDYCAQK